MDNPSISVSEDVLNMRVRDLVGRKDLAYAFGRQAVKYAHLNALADVNFEAAVNRPNTIPFSVKDHLRVKGMVQTCGLSSNITPGTYTCEVARILEENGMTPYVQSNVPQGLWGLESTNYVFGQCANPYNKDFTGGGSSGGEAVLVKTRSSPFGLGSDSAGSLRIPASFSGVYSFKPTGSRRMSRVGRIAISGE